MCTKITISIIIITIIVSVKVLMSVEHAAQKLLLVAFCKYKLSTSCK